MCAKIVGDALWRSINCRFPVQPFHVHCVALNSLVANTVKAIAGMFR